ncbi:MAG: sulfatase [Planctomycetaceae bacterium]|nr:sulfatase [Planctomycetaceae bacterium]
MLFLVVDDMKDWVNCLDGYSGTVHTPHIDQLAVRGMLFQNAHCVSPRCAPSRAAVLTGLRPSTTGLYDNGHWWFPNLPDTITIPQHFRRHGYRVGGAGKIFHHTAGNHPLHLWDTFHRLTFQEDPWFRGSALNYPWSASGAPPDGFPFSGVSGLGHENDWGSLTIAAEDYDDAVTTQFAIDFLRQQADKKSSPFFLACGLFRPHLPWYVPQEFFELYPLDEIVLPVVPENDLDDLPEAGRQLAKDRRSDWKTVRKADRWKHAVQAYLASISCADARMGQILTALQQAKLADDTIVVLWSDHGWHLGEKQHWHKSTLWEESTHVPLIIAGAGIQSGTCRRSVSLLDVYPTLNELARLPAIPSHEGHSLVPLLRDPGRKWDRPAVTEFRRGNAAVRSERFRYIRYHDGGEELYDHRTDPHEWTNLAANRDYASVKERLSRWLPDHWAPSADTKKAFEFDHQSFTWTHRETGRVISGKK